MLEQPIVVKSPRDQEAPGIRAQSPGTRAYQHPQHPVSGCQLTQAEVITIPCPAWGQAKEPRGGTGGRLLKSSRSRGGDGEGCVWWG